MPATRGLFVALLLAASCARSPSAERAPYPAVDRNVIANEELQNPVLRGMDAIRMIRYLRPAFFRESGPQSFMNAGAGALQFSMDYGPVQPLGNLSSVPSLSLQMAYEIRYLDLNDAANRFGITANGGPVIVVVSNKP